MAGKDGYSAKITVTRPANTTAYSAGDVFGAAAAALEFPQMGVPGRDIIINSSTLAIDLSAIPSGMTSFTLHLYDVTPPSALADNAAWDLPSGDRDSYLGSIALGTLADVGSTLFIQANSHAKQVRLKSSSLFGYLVTAAGYTPTSGEVARISLNATAL